MAVRKIAISIPEEALRQVDRLAKKTKTTRSGFITKLLKEVSHASGQSDIINRINSLFEDKDIFEEQISTANLFLNDSKKKYKASNW